MVTKLAQSIKTSDVLLCFDRFFTSVNLMHTLPYPSVGTCMANRKNLPKYNSKLQRGECQMLNCKEGLLICPWKDTRDVIILSNCHKAKSETISRKMRDGSHKAVVLNLFLMADPFRYCLSSCRPLTINFQ